MPKKRRFKSFPLQSLETFGGLTGPIYRKKLFSSTTSDAYNVDITRNCKSLSVFFFQTGGAIGSIRFYQWCTSVGGLDLTHLHVDEMPLRSMNGDQEK